MSDNDLPTGRLPIDLWDPPSDLDDDELDAQLLAFLDIEDTPENRAKFREAIETSTEPVPSK